MAIYHVYITTNKRPLRALHRGDGYLAARIQQHRDGIGGEFTRKYKANVLVYYEEFAAVTEAIAREKQIKAGSRAKKMALINDFNPGWLDLFPDVIA